MNNELSGVIPPELGNLVHLEALGLNENQLSGPILAELGSLTNLECLGLGDDQMSGPILAELAGLTNLHYLRIAGNQFSGCIPKGLGVTAVAGPSGGSYLGTPTFTGSVCPTANEQRSTARRGREWLRGCLRGSTNVGSRASSFISSGSSVAVCGVRWEGPGRAQMETIVDDAGRVAWSRFLGSPPGSRRAVARSCSTRGESSRSASIDERSPPAERRLADWRERHGQERQSAH